MDSYIDDKYAVLDGSLVSMSERRREITIPAEAGGHRITRIGKGLFGGEEINTLRISEGIEEIGSEAFSTTALRRIYLPASLKVVEKLNIHPPVYDYSQAAQIIFKRRMNERTFRDICDSSIRLTGDRWVLGSACNSSSVFEPLFKGQITSGGTDVFPPQLIDKRMNGLYFESEFKGITIQLPFDGIRETMTTEYIHDQKAFRRAMIRFLIKENKAIYMNAAAELRHDRHTVNRRIDIRPDVLLTVFGKKDVTADENGLTVDFNIYLTPVYFPQLLKVNHEGKNYYIYRECFLYGPDEIPYNITEEDAAAYDETGTAIGGRIADAVIGKYKMMCMLT